MPPAAAADGATLPAVVGATLAAPVGATLPAPLALGEDELQAAMTAPIEPIDRPTIAARWMNSRRLSRPPAKASTTSS